MLRSGSDTLMVSTNHATNQSKSKNNAIGSNSSKSSESLSLTPKAVTKSVSTQSTSSCNNTTSSSSSSSSSSSASISSVKNSTKSKTKSNGTHHYTRSNGDSPNSSNKSSSKETNVDETATSTHPIFRPSFNAATTPPFKRYKTSYITENEKDAQTIKYNTPSRIHHNIYPALGNVSHFSQPAFPLPHHPSALPARPNYDRSSQCYTDKPTEGRPIDDVTPFHHQYYGNNADDNYSSTFHGFAMGPLSRKAPNDIEYQFHNYTKPIPIRFCVCFVQGQYCSPCHIVHMIMHKYNFPCGTKNCEYDENLNDGTVQNEQPTSYPVYNHHQPSEYSCNPSYIHQSNSYYSMQPPPFSSNPSDYYSNYVHENYYSSQSKLAP